MGELRAGYRLGVASVRHVFRFLALALILSGLFSGHFPRCANGQLTSAKRRELLIRGFTDIPRYLSIDGVGAVLVAPNIVLVLDCYFFGFRLYGQQWNVSALEWSFNNVPIGLIESRRLQLRNSGIQLVINSTTLESGAEDSTDGLYSCRVCAFDGRCQRTNTRIMIFAPPIIETDCSDVPDFLEPVTGFLSFTAGCDLCFEVGQEIQTLEVDCRPSGFLSRQPVTCNFQIGTEPVTPIPGRLESEFGTLTFTNLINPPLSPELNLLQTYTCNCSNDDGFVLASTTIGSCFVLPQILKGTPIRPFDGQFVDPGEKRIIIGSNNSIQVGFDFQIECRILRGIPPPTISWFLNGVELSGENTSYLIVNTDDPNAASGRYTCVATNRVGNDSASSNLRYGIEIVQPPTITEAPKLPQPDINVVGTIREQVGANVFVIIGERFELTCNITQPVLPEVMYSWFKDGRAVNGSAENEQIFVMDNTTRGAFGLYCCKAVNIGGLSQACSRVVPLESGPILRTQPSSPSPRLPEQVTIAQTTVSIGGSLWTSDRGFGVITCEVILSNPPISSIEWFVGDPPVMIDENTAGVLFDRINITTDLGAMISHLVIRPTLSGDRANFTCLATSPAGTDRATSEYGVIVPPILAAGTPSPVPITVAPVMVTEVVGSTVHAVQDQSITLECVLVNGTGLPRDTVEFNWYRFSTPLQNDSRISIQSTSIGSILTIQNASREDSGLFRCGAQNPAGFNAVSSDVFVYSMPTIDVGNDTIIGPALPQGKIGNTFIVVKGSRVFINCDILDGGGFPHQPEMNLPATILWFLDGEPVDPSLFSDDHDNQLCFNAVDFDSGGNITCTAISRIREDGEFLQDSASSIVTVVSMPSFDANFSAVVAQPGERTIIADTQFTRYFVTRGTNLRVLCGVVSTPAANFTWRRYNETESEMEITPSGRLAISAVDGGSQLSIDNFSPGDVGVYKCTGTNIAGSVELSFRVDVCPEVQNCSGSENFTIQASPHPDTRDNCTFCAYYYKGSYGPCDRTCHDGIRTRRIECRVEHRIIDIPLCSEFSQPPSETDTCRSIFPGRPCSVLEPRWVVGQWGKCTRTCGRGYQLRTVKCYLEDTHSFVSASRCTDFRPINWRSCNQRSCGCTDVDPNCSQINTRLCLQEHVRISCCITCLTLAPNTFPSHHH